MRVMKQLRAAAAALLLLAAAGCSNDGSPVNSPYESGAESRNTLYSAFVKRSPKYLTRPALIPMTRRLIPTTSMKRSTAITT